MSVPADTEVVPVKSLSVEGVSVKVLVPDLVKPPAPVILPVKIWSDVDDEYVSVLPDEVRVIRPAYEAGVVLAPRVPEIVMLPPEAEIVVFPEYVLAPDKVSVPEPDFVSEPVPETTPPYEYASDRFTTSAELFVMLPATEPVVEPDPIETVPAEIVRDPRKEFVPVNVSVPVPVFVRLPELADVVPLYVVEVSSPPDVNVPVNVMAPDPASEPTVSAFPPMSRVPFTVNAEPSGITPAAPSVRVPAVTVVVPE